MKSLKIDDKFTAQYDPSNNDTMVEIHRYGEVHDVLEPTKTPNWARAALYSLLEARQELAAIKKLYKHDDDDDESETLSAMRYLMNL